MEAHTADMLHKLQGRYLATLLQEDGTVVNQATCQCHIVLKICVYGALLWPCSKHEEPGFRYFSPCVEPCVQASWKAVLDADAWLPIPCVRSSSSSGSVLFGWAPFRAAYRGGGFADWW